MSLNSALFFAAGLGTRMGELVKNTPKPLIHVDGKPLIDHALSQAKDIKNKVVNIHYRGDMIQQHLGNQVQYSHESDTLLETGGGLRHALPLLGTGPVYTMNSDVIWSGPNPFKTLAASWNDITMEALVLLVPPNRAHGHLGQGDFVLDAQNRITRGAGYIYTGAQITKTDGLASIPDRAFSLNVLWNKMIQRGTLFGVVYNGDWCDVGQPQSIPIAEAMLREKT